MKKVCALLKGIPECTVSDNHLALQSKLPGNWQTFRVTGSILRFVDSSLGAPRKVQNGLKNIPTIHCLFIESKDVVLLCLPGLYVSKSVLCLL